jgi:serine phosphatase RsbU (regulator of sigma subunit)
MAADDPAPATVRRLLRSVLTHQADQLQDDASIVVLEWLPGEVRSLSL